MMGITRFCLVLLLSWTSISSAESISNIPQSADLLVIKGFKGSDIVGRSLFSCLSRLYVYQHESKGLSKDQIISHAKYTFSVQPNSDFYLGYNETIAQTYPFYSIVAEPIDTHSKFVITKEIPANAYKCNKDPIVLDGFKDLADSCIDITMSFAGEGKYYILAREKGVDPPDSVNIIEEGVYLGTHSHGSVTTKYCDFNENSEYVLYASVIGGECIHSVTTFPIKIGHYSSESKWGPNRNILWADRLIQFAPKHHGIKYRRYGSGLYPSSSFKDVKMNDNGLLLSSMKDVLELSSKYYGAEPEDAAVEEIVNHNIQWRTGDVEMGTFKGVLIVFGKGDVYLYYKAGNSPVSVETVVKKGKNIGYFDEDSVDVVIEDVEPGVVTFYAVLVSGQQYFGPFSKTSG